ncbi:hypothetical protein OKW76_07105 [Sphingomonas sp. S1-29]|uniref:hypothetical protein n=1 Tax=Sphingomonas sp. S1-29 TaxID=2991074 RepID=UPI00223F4197|nr:hypothetical protein [Sphingomonas sp. S1-29]UZK70783.1 hypothetical protein OKW76_07105 [Sphingomonas sp. S1-29]
MTKAVINILHEHFTRFVDGKERLIGNSYSKMHLLPAFFIDDKVKCEVEMVYEPFGPLPFERLWVVYQTDNGIFGPATNIVSVYDGDVMTMFKLSAQADLKPSIMLRLDDPSSAVAPSAVDAKLAIMETLPELRFVFGAIMKQDREIVTPDALTKLNRKRGYAGKSKLAPFITIKNTITAPQPHQGGTHKSPVGHERREHFRTSRKTGKSYPVKASSVNGGSYVPRNYRVET